MGWVRVLNNVFQMHSLLRRREITGQVDAATAVRSVVLGQQLNGLALSTQRSFERAHTASVRTLSLDPLEHR